MARLKFRYGEMELEYDGPEQFLKDELTNFVGAFSALGAIAPSPAKRAAEPGVVSKPHGNSVSAIAQKLDVKAGTDLIMAAAAALTLTGKDSFSKKELRDCMRQATVYWKSVYASNFDKYVTRLVKKGRLNHTGGTNHSVPAEEMKLLNQRLAATA